MGASGDAPRPIRPGDVLRTQWLAGSLVLDCFELDPAKLERVRAERVRPES